MKEPVRADRPADYVESDLADLAAVSVAELRRYPALTISRRLLDDTRRPRSNAIGDSPPQPGRAE
ncbi:MULTISPECIES: aldo/keto reductase [Streptomyces]|uniref:aldo/keto reductase n=1 Tax=Streptomyces TaxID=1883 RepID=UPI00210BC7E8|nr:aldo/keto reductase [Streptomyces longispororuber]MCQ4211164.1 aldo/keto reductase [Streptomyces longispororuber]